MFFANQAALIADQQNFMKQGIDGFTVSTDKISNRSEVGLHSSRKRNEL